MNIDRDPDRAEGFDEHGYYVRCVRCALTFRPVNGKSAYAHYEQHRGEVHQ